MSASVAAGTRFGALTVEGEAEPRYTGERQAILRCDCGRPALRTFAYLKSMPPGRKPACVICLQEWRSGTFADRRAVKRLRWLACWERFGALYTDHFDRCEADALAAELELPPAQLESIPVASSLSIRDYRSPGHGQHLHPHTFSECVECESCGSAFQVGFACVACMLALCAECGGRHGGEQTLEEIGLNGKLGARGGSVSRERARQILFMAIESARKAARDWRAA